MTIRLVFVFSAVWSILSGAFPDSSIVVVGIPAALVLFDPFSRICLPVSSSWFLMSTRNVDPAPSGLVTIADAEIMTWTIMMFEVNFCARVMATPRASSA